MAKKKNSLDGCSAILGIPFLVALLLIVMLALIRYAEFWIIVGAFGIIFGLIYGISHYSALDALKNKNRVKDISRVDAESRAIIDRERNKMRFGFGSLAASVVIVTIAVVAVLNQPYAEKQPTTSIRTTYAAQVYRTTKAYTTTSAPETTTEPGPTEPETTTEEKTSPVYPKIVYWGATGAKYHIDPYCRSFKGRAAHSGTLNQAKAAGRSGWCGICSIGWTDSELLERGNPNAD